MSKVSPYAKFVVAALAAAAVALQAAISDGTVTSSEWVGVGIAALAALGVWAVPNRRA
jgi:hypothetical protein